METEVSILLFFGILSFLCAFKTADAGWFVFYTFASAALLTGAFYFNATG